MAAVSGHLLALDLTWALSAATSSSSAATAALSSAISACHAYRWAECKCQHSLTCLSLDEVDEVLSNPGVLMLQSMLYAVCRCKEADASLQHALHGNLKQSEATKQDSEAQHSGACPDLRIRDRCL